MITIVLDGRYLVIAGAILNLIGLFAVFYDRFRIHRERYLPLYIIPADRGSNYACYRRY